jgi:hypothetical protein
MKVEKKKKTEFGTYHKNLAIWILFFPRESGKFG